MFSRKSRITDVGGLRDVRVQKPPILRFLHLLLIVLGLMSRFHYVRRNVPKHWAEIHHNDWASRTSRKRCLALLVCDVFADQKRKLDPHRAEKKIRHRRV